MREVGARLLAPWRCHWRAALALGEGLPLHEVAGKGLPRAAVWARL